MAKDIKYLMKENWHVKVTAKKFRGNRDREIIKEEPTFKFEFQVQAIYNFLEIKGLAKTIVKERLGTYWEVTEVSLEMAGGE